MGYSTEFIGELLFTKELKASEIVKIKSFLGQDCRNHPEWNAKQLTHIDLELTDDFTGLKWDGSEKTYDLVEKVNLIITMMRKDYSDFGLSGSLLAQGEDIHDKWMLSIDNNGKAIESKIDFKIDKITCPHCQKDFILETPE